MAADSVVLRFSEVTFDYGESKPILDEASFSLRAGTKIALMGQNGAGKSSLFGLILGENKPKKGGIFITPPDAKIGIAKQVIPREKLDLTVKEWFSEQFEPVPYNIDKRIAQVLEAVNLTTDTSKKLREHSGGQQARLLLAYSIIAEPDLLLLDEPTNNLDQAGIEHLTGFLMMYEKAVLVISHDAEFLNAFTDGVLYLDVHTQKIEQHVGNYLNVVEEIAARIERERANNARAEAEIRRKREQAEVFAHKGGKLRSVAKRMREAAEEAEDSMVEERREDRIIREFTIPAQQFDPFFHGRILDIEKVGIIKNGEYVEKHLGRELRKGTHMVLAGPNGIGKSTLLEKIYQDKAPGITRGEGVRVGYYRQDFSTLDFDQKAFDSLMDAMQHKDEQELRSTAAGFLLDGKALGTQIKYLSEGQKGLLSFARLMLMKPGLLILDEPTNHINFRHLPIIATALDQYEGAMVLVSHVPEFVNQIRIDDVLELDK
ncbi:MAG: hypothetical protein RLZZ324_1022 [Candidatus Parcubacteria bacterium]